MNKKYIMLIQVDIDGPLPVRLTASAIRFRNVSFLLRCKHKTNVIMALICL